MAADLFAIVPKTLSKQIWYFEAFLVVPFSCVCARSPTFRQICFLHSNVHDVLEDYLKLNQGTESFIYLVYFKRLFSWRCGTRQRRRVTLWQNTDLLVLVLGGHNHAHESDCVLQGEWTAAPVRSKLNLDVVYLAPRLCRNMNVL